MRKREVTEKVLGVGGECSKADAAPGPKCALQLVRFFRESDLLAAAMCNTIRVTAGGFPRLWER